MLANKLEHVIVSGLSLCGDVVLRLRADKEGGRRADRQGGNGWAQIFFAIVMVLPTG
jgi:hypothetical protein